MVCHLEGSASNNASVIHVPLSSNDNFCHILTLSKYIREWEAGDCSKQDHSSMEYGQNIHTGLHRDRE